VPYKLTPSKPLSKAILLGLVRLTKNGLISPIISEEFSKAKGMRLQKLLQRKLLLNRIAAIQMPLLGSVIKRRGAHSFQTVGVANL
jgi:hypothetical protein